MAYKKAHKSSQLLADSSEVSNARLAAAAESVLVAPQDDEVNAANLETALHAGLEGRAELAEGLRRNFTTAPPK